MSSRVLLLAALVAANEPIYPYTPGEETPLVQLDDSKCVGHARIPPLHCF